jgi:hypothetical protein
MVQQLSVLSFILPILYGYLLKVLHR